jgi:hypothetical protein
MKASSGEDYVSETYGSSRDHGDTTTSDGGGPERFPGTSDQPDLDPHYYEGDIWGPVRAGLARASSSPARRLCQPASPRTVTVCLRARHPLGAARVPVTTACPISLDMPIYRPSL